MSASQGYPQQICEALTFPEMDTLLRAALALFDPVSVYENVILYAAENGHTACAIHIVLTSDAGTQRFHWRTITRGVIGRRDSPEVFRAYLSIAKTFVLRSVLRTNAIPDNVRVDIARYFPDEFLAFASRVTHQVIERYVEV